MRLATERIAPVYSTPSLHAHTRAAQSPVGRGLGLTHRTILVATDGSAESRAATAVASVIARLRHAHVVAMRAFDYGAPITHSDVVITPWMNECDALEISRHLLRAELSRDIGEVCDWDVRAVAGRPAHAVAAEANALDAALIVMGLRRARQWGGVIRHDTALRLLGEVHVPVLATTGALAEVPRRIVLGTDFSASSIRTARIALSVLADRGTLVLTFVQPSPEACERADGHLRPLSPGELEAGFDRMHDALKYAREVRMERVVVDGDVPWSLLSIADRSFSDCIAVGSGGHALDDQHGPGRVARTLVTCGKRPLLVVPPPRGAFGFATRTRDRIADA
jgi:nucleotide-binding universal stress UspA family protein